MPGALNQRIAHSLRGPSGSGLNVTAKAKQVSDAFFLFTCRSQCPVFASQSQRTRSRTIAAPLALSLSFVISSRHHSEEAQQPENEGRPCARDSKLELPGPASHGQPLRGGSFRGDRGLPKPRCLACVYRRESWRSYGSLR